MQQGKSNWRGEANKHSIEEAANQPNKHDWTDETKSEIRKWIPKMKSENTRQSIKLSITCLRLPKPKDPIENTRLTHVSGDGRQVIP